MRGPFALARALHSAHGEDRGAVALEFALILPVFIMLVFGVVTGGLAYNDKLSVANAVREGARFGSAIDYANPGSGTWADDVQQRVAQTYFNGTLDPTDVCVVLRNSTGGQVAAPTTETASCTNGDDPEPSAPSFVPAGSCVVKVWLDKDETMTLGLLPSIHFTIGAQSVSYYNLDVNPDCPGA
jgi:Flp pilus assembly protein TadG